MDIDKSQWGYSFLGQNRLCNTTGIVSVLGDALRTPWCTGNFSQWLMGWVINGLDAFEAAYLDDLVIYSSTLEKNLTQQRVVLDHLRSARLTAKPSKCQFEMSRCTYLGHVVGGGHVCPDSSKIQCVESFPTPTNKMQVRRFLGLTGYYRKFFPDYVKIAAPLADLTRKNKSNHVAWTVECDKAFQELKLILCSSPVLASPDFTRPITLQTDASHCGVGAVLSQYDDDGLEHPVAYSAGSC